jgi:hypothetical protein
MKTHELLLQDLTLIFGIKAVFDDNNLEQDVLNVEISRTYSYYKEGKKVNLLHGFINFICPKNQYSTDFLQDKFEVFLQSVVDTIQPKGTLKLDTDSDRLNFNVGNRSFTKISVGYSYILESEFNIIREKFSNEYEVIINEKE